MLMVNNEHTVALPGSFRRNCYYHSSRAIVAILGVSCGLDHHFEVSLSD